MGVAIIDAARAAKKNQETHAQLVKRQGRLNEQNEREGARQEDERHRVYDDAIAPFCDAFGRLKNVDLHELSDVDLPVSYDVPKVELQKEGLAASGLLGAIAGGGIAGAGAGAATFAAVGALATASTGTAISGLSGAAATSAILAWLGGGSVAAGGGGVAAGTTVMTGIVAAPVVIALGVVLEWQGRKARRAQREVAAKLATADAELKLAETRSSAVRARSEQVRVILSRLNEQISHRLPAFVALVDGNDDYATYTDDQRGYVAALTSLVTTAAAVMATPLIDDAGVVTDLSADVVEDARQRLSALEAPAA